MTKHDIENGTFTSKSGKITNYKCKVCYRAWVNPTSTDCAGKLKITPKGGTPIPKAKPKGKPKGKTPKHPLEVLNENIVHKYDSHQQAQKDKGIWITKKERRERRALIVQSDDGGRRF